MNVPNAFQSAAIGMALAGLDGRWLRVNPETCRLLGYSERELLSTTVEKLVLHFTGEHAEEALGHLAVDAAPLPYCTEKRLRRGDGSSIWASLHITVVQDCNGQPDSLLVQLQDITSRRTAEEVEERMFELPVALHYVAGFDGYFKKLSASWESALGYPTDYLLSVPYLDLVHLDDRLSTVSEAQGVEVGSNTFLFENRYRHADGSYRWILWTSVTAPKEKLIYGVALDYTKRKEAELKLAETVKELEEVLEELHASQEQINKLREGLITICAWTKQIFHQGNWIPVDEFLSQHLKLRLTHGISHEAVGMMQKDLAQTIQESREGNP